MYGESGAKEHGPVSRRHKKTSLDFQNRFRYTVKNFPCSFEPAANSRRHP
jgi:hypothetical protein